MEINSNFPATASNSLKMRGNSFTGYQYGAGAVGTAQRPTIGPRGWSDQMSNDKWPISNRAKIPPKWEAYPGALQKPELGAEGPDRNGNTGDVAGLPTNLLMEFNEVCREATSQTHTSLHQLQQPYTPDFLRREVFRGGSPSSHLLVDTPPDAGLQAPVSRFSDELSPSIVNGDGQRIFVEVSPVKEKLESPDFPEPMGVLNQGSAPPLVSPFRLKETFLNPQVGIKSALPGCTFGGVIQDFPQHFALNVKECCEDFPGEFQECFPHPPGNESSVQPFLTEVFPQPDFASQSFSGGVGLPHSHGRFFLSSPLGTAGQLFTPGQTRFFWDPAAQKFLMIDGDSHEITPVMSRAEAMRFHTVPHGGYPSTPTQKTTEKTDSNLHGPQPNDTGNPKGMAGTPPLASFPELSRFDPRFSEQMSSPELLSDIPMVEESDTTMVPSQGGGFGPLNTPEMQPNKAPPGGVPVMGQCMSPGECPTVEWRRYLGAAAVAKGVVVAPSQLVTLPPQAGCSQVGCSTLSLEDLRQPCLGPPDARTACGFEFRMDSGWEEFSRADWGCEEGFVVSMDVPPPTPICPMPDSGATELGIEGRGYLISPFPGQGGSGSGDPLPPWDNDPRMDASEGGGWMGTSCPQPPDILIDLREP